MGEEGLRDRTQSEGNSYYCRCQREQIQNFGFRGEKLSCERKKELEDESCWVDVMKMCRRRNISALLRDKL